MGVGALALRSHEAGGVAVIDHDDRAIRLRKHRDLGQFGQIAVHREHAVGGDHDEAGAGVPCFLETGFEFVHIGVRVAVAPRLAKPDAIDDRGVVQRVRDDRVLRPEQRLEQPAIGLEAGGEQDRVILAEEAGEPVFQLAMEILGAADEADAGHAIAVLVHRALRRLDQPGVVGETEIVVGAEIDDPVVVTSVMTDSDPSSLRRDDLAFTLVEAVVVDLLQRGRQIVEKSRDHECCSCCAHDYDGNRLPSI